MTKFNIGFFIARRISFDKSAGKPNIMVRIASLTAAVGMTVMIISIAVISGFRKEISDKLVGFGAHIQILSAMNNNSLETTPIHRDTLLEKQIREMDFCRQLYPFAVKGGMLKVEDNIQGIMLKGVNENYDWSFFRKNLVQGDIPTITDTTRNKDILISKSLAQLMTIKVKDRVEILFIREGEMPRSDRYRICGIYETGFEELDKLVVMTDIRNIRKLNRWETDQVTGYEIITTDMDNIDRSKKQIDRLIEQRQNSESLTTYDIQSRFANLFDWLKTHNVNGIIIITIMLTVALLNMISAMLIILLERTAMIGTLKAIGMSNRALQRMFVMRSMFILGKGILWGNIIGLILCAIQAIWHPIKLGQAEYSLSAVPIHLNPYHIAILNIATFVIIMLLLSIATRIVSRITPDTTLRYNR